MLRVVAIKKRLVVHLRHLNEGSSKKRLVVNLRSLNNFLWKQKFKYEDLHTALLLRIKGDMAFTFDLKSEIKSENHITNIHKNCWKYTLA